MSSQRPRPQEACSLSSYCRPASSRTLSHAHSKTGKPRLPLPPHLTEEGEAEAPEGQGSALGVPRPSAWDAFPIPVYPSF